MGYAATWRQSCPVPRPHYSARPMSFESRGPSELRNAGIYRETPYRGCTEGLWNRNTELGEFDTLITFFVGYCVILDVNIFMKWK